MHHTGRMLQLVTTLSETCKPTALRGSAPGVLKKLHNHDIGFTEAIDSSNAIEADAVTGIQLQDHVGAAIVDMRHCFRCPWYKWQS